ncbi:MAG: hypothetical protein AAF401_04660 [Pseudomonadota bacterium]
MSEDEVRTALAAIAEGDDVLTHRARLAWRPAWSIRSRKGAWAAFLDMLKGRS